MQLRNRNFGFLDLMIVRAVITSALHVLVQSRGNLLWGQMGEGGWHPKEDWRPLMWDLVPCLCI